MNTQSAIDKGKDAAERASREMRDEIEGLTAQVEKLASDLARIGKSGVKSARAGASQGLDVLGRTRAEVADGIGRELTHVQERAALEVRERPVQSLGLAVLLGFLLAIFLRR
jgi:ElaB/YqjD/DUF883 family membrane-anchored ribosome-binding protein